MKTFIDWAKGKYNEIASTPKGKSEFDLYKSVKKRENKGTGKGECPICQEDPCVCKTANIKNRLKKYQK